MQQNFANNLYRKLDRRVVSVANRPSPRYRRPILTAFARHLPLRLSGKPLPARDRLCCRAPCIRMHFHLPIRTIFPIPHLLHPTHTHTSTKVGSRRAKHINRKTRPTRTSNFANSIIRTQSGGAHECSNFPYTCYDNDDRLDSNRPRRSDDIPRFGSAIPAGRHTNIIVRRPTSVFVFRALRRLTRALKVSRNNVCALRNAELPIAEYRTACMMAANYALSCCDNSASKLRSNLERFHHETLACTNGCNFCARPHWHVHIHINTLSGKRHRPHSIVATTTTTTCSFRAPDSCLHTLSARPNHSSHPKARFLM